MSDFNSILATLIQRTPHIDVLIQVLERKGYPTVENKRSVTQYLKARRLYDVLFRVSPEYPDPVKHKLRKLFRDTGNGYAGDLFFSMKQPPEYDSINFWKSTVQSVITEHAQNIRNPGNQKSLSISRSSMLQVFASAKLGNATKMDSLMRVLAANCVQMHLSAQELRRFADIDKIIDNNLELFRASLGSALLNKKDWSDKTLLHVAIDAKTLECVDIVLRYANEAGIKAEILDAKDAFGNTALLMAIRRRDIAKSKKLIFEGSDVFLPNHKNQFPLQVIYQRFPKMGSFLFDKAITVSGDVSSEAFCLNIDFGVIATFIEIKEDDENRLFPLLEARRNLVRGKIASYVVQIPDENSAQEQKVFVPSAGTSRSTSINFASESYMKDLLGREDEMQALASLVYNDIKSCSHLLQHPVTRLFLNLKWNRLKFIIFANSAFRTFFYFMYLTLTFRIYFVDCPHKSTTIANYDENNWNESREFDDIQHYKCAWSSPTQVLVPVVTFLTAIHIFSEIFKLPLILQVSRFKKYWFGYLGMGAWTRILFFFVAMLTSTTPFYLSSFHSSQYLLAIIGVMLGSILLLQVIGDSNFSFCFHSIYVHVYTRVLSRFLTVIATFSAIILGFAISFSIVFPQPKEFSTFARSAFRLLIMIHGEFDFEDKSIKADSEGDAWVFWSGQILYVLFGSIITLVLIDVFLGYTVSDIKELKEQAEDVRRFIQIQQLFVVEKSLLSMRSIVKAIFRSSLQFSLIPETRKKKNRNDVIVGFEELDEQMQAEFRDFITET